MTDNNANDPLPESENLGSAGSLHSSERRFHRRSSNFEPTTEERPPAHCEICGASISPTQRRCSDHRTEPTSSENEIWSISNVAVVIVPASSRFHALANAAVAFRRRDESPGGEDSFDLVYDFGELSQTLTSDWDNDLPDATKLSSPSGEALVTEAISKSPLGSDGQVWEISGIEINASILGEPSESAPYLFDERGEALTEESQLSAFESGPEDETRDYWVVTGVLYDRTGDVSHQTTRHTGCSNCGPTEHVFDGFTDVPEGTDRAGLWACRNCGDQKIGNPPSQ